jgi:starch phosphorylase
LFPSQCSHLQIEITREIGDSNIFLFGNLAEDVEDLRHAHNYGSHAVDAELGSVFEAIRANRFGDAGSFSALVAAVTDHGDYYLVSDDFSSYLRTQELVDEAYKNQDEWTAKCITSVSRMGFFSSDRCIAEYGDGIWNVEPLAPQ